MNKPFFAFLKTAVLLLLISSCTIKNRNVAGELNSLQDTDWALLAIGEQEVTVEQNTRTSYIHFNKDDNKVKGFGSCNNFFGRYTLTGDKVKLSNLGSTRMACPHMEQETRLMQALEKVTSYSIAGQLLTLYGEGKALATFRAAYGQPLDQEPGR